MSAASPVINRQLYPNVWASVAIAKVNNARWSDRTFRQTRVLDSLLRTLNFLKVISPDVIDMLKEWLARRERAVH